MKILFAEDSVSVANVIIQKLEAEKHVVVHVRDGEQAISAFIDDTPDLVLMDIVMPKVNGIDAIRAIRKYPSRKWIPIVVLTSMGGNSEFIKAFDAGADDYLLKPIDLDVLTARMRSKQRIIELQSSFFGVLDNVHEGILTINALGVIQTFNFAAERIFGYSFEEVKGCNVNILMPEPYHSDHDKYMRQYLATSIPKVIGIGRKVEGKRKDGEVFPMHLAVTQINTARGIQFIGLVRDISQEEADRKHIEFLALHDPLTGLPNRASFNSFHAAITTQNSKYALLFIDIDGFKPVNDNFGHDVGDMVLQGIARILQSTLPGNAFIARLGGDEFVAILPEVDSDAQATLSAEQVIRSLSAPLICGDCRCHVGASIGVALFPQSGATQEAILNAADEAMYSAKRSGKNRVVVSSKN